jgi:hypothetical protein
VLRIHIGLHVDLDPAFYFNADPDPGRQTNKDHANPTGTFKSQNV